MISKHQRIALRICSLIAATLLSCNTHAASEDTCPWQDKSALLVSGAVTAPELTDRLTQVAMRQDLDCLKRVYQYQYIGTYYPHAIDLEAGVTSAKKTLASSMRVIDFMQLIMQTHLPIYDRHFSLNCQTNNDGNYMGMPRYYLYRLRKTFKQTKTGYVTWNASRHQAETIQSCQDFIPYHTPIKDQVIFVGLHFKQNAPRFATCQLSNQQPIKLSVIELPYQSVTLPERMMMRRLDKNIWYVRIPNAGMGLTKPEQDLLTMVSNNAFQEDLVIDLRDNHGGSDLFGKKLLSALTTKKDKLSNGSPTMTLDTVYNNAAELNMIHNLLIGQSTNILLNRIKTIYQTRFAKKDEDLANNTNKTTTFIEETDESNALPYPSRGERNTPYHGTILLLANRACASGCEDFIESIKTLTSTRLLGTHTAGAYNYSDVGFLILPNTRIQLCTTTGAVQSSPIRDGIGFAPDIYLTSGNWINIGVEYIKQHANERDRLFK